ncbi:hypothetical protein MMC30_002563 [Trapelia coarctata]|nr:hypothetical protein [Trapelia coarctata]
MPPAERPRFPVPLSTLPIQAVLLALCAAGCYLTWGLFIGNGSKALMEHIRDVGPHILTGTDAPIKQIYTGIGPLDEQLGVLTVFFWEIVDGSMPHASLHAIRFGAQVMVMWGLVMIEGMRTGNRGSIVSYVMIWGLFVQNATFAVAIPIFLILSLARSTNISPSEEAITADIIEVISIPASLFLGFAVPAVMLALPAPTMQSFEAKQTWMAIWQGFPIWVAIFQQIIKHYVSLMLPIYDRQPTASKWEALQKMYTILGAVAAISHIAPMALTVTSSIFPGLLPAEYGEAFKFSTVMVPAAITSATQMSTIGLGAFMLLQYDEIVGSTAVLFWALFMFLQACNWYHVPRPGAGAFWRLALFTVLTGPVSSAVSLISARDGILLEQEEETFMQQKDVVGLGQKEKQKAGRSG